MNIVVQRVTDELVRLVLTGDLDLGTVRQLIDGVEQAIVVNQPRRLVVDLAAVSFCDSTGVGALVEAREAAARRGVALYLANADGLTRRIMQLIGVLEALDA